MVKHISDLPEKVLIVDGQNIVVKQKTKAAGIYVVPSENMEHLNLNTKYFMKEKTLNGF